MVSSGLQMALFHVAAALPLVPMGPVNLTTITHCSSKWTEMRIHPCDVLPAANEKQVACLCSVRREERGGRRAHPATAQAHIPGAAPGDTAGREVQNSSTQTTPGTPRPWGRACPQPSLSLRPPQPFLLRGTGPGPGRGQEGSQSLSHWEGTVGSRAVVSVGRTEMMGRSRRSLSWI